jgi:hypothetical protein
LELVVFLVRETGSRSHYTVRNEQSKLGSNVEIIIPKNSLQITKQNKNGELPLMARLNFKPPTVKTTGNAS